jgi:non-specific protein-tyrosine kinase
MSRIQNILNKAERDGTVRRMRGLTDAGPAFASLESGAAAIPAPLPAVPVTPVTHVVPSMPVSSVVSPDIGAPAATAVPQTYPLRTVRGPHLAPTLVAALAPDAVTAEQYRALRTRVLHADNGAPVHLLLVTSPGRGEGKTVTAANLALAMAQEFQQRVCLVDANLRSPHVHRLFDLPEAPGLTDVLVGRAALEDALVAIEDFEITILPAGDPAAHPAELLGSASMRRLLDSLRSHFDRVVIDAPPTAPLADVGIITPLVDNVVLVVRAGVTSKPSIQDAVAAIDHGKLLGVVLNEAG